jgi:rhodanese-related sulfurtransferase
MRLFLFLILAFTSEIVFCQDTGAFKCMTISKDDFYSDMKLKPEIKIIDVRSKSEFLAERIEGAVNIPVSKLPCRKAKKISRETVIYLYCKSGVRSCTAESKFNDMGFKHVFSLENGLSYWEKSGFPVVCGRKGIRRTEFIPRSPYQPIAAPHIK